MQQHRRAFYLGSILPDCKLSFLTERHEFYGTFAKISENIRSLTENCNAKATDTISYWRQLGEVIHYMADYFTFPHNRSYDGGLRDHCIYEKKLRDHLKEYISSGKAALEKTAERVFESVDALLDFIRQSHNEYMSGTHTVEDDVRYIVRLCQQVISGIVQLVKRYVCDAEMIGEVVPV